MAEKDDRYREAIQRTLVECGPAADGVLTPKWYVEGETELFGGVGIDETRAFAMKALERRLKVIGLAPVA
jgi:ribonucleoside-diphosphate reductase beta chain